MVRAVDANGLSLLSKREMDVVRSLAEGLTNREIAERLGLSQHTIKNYLFRVYDKLGVSSRLELLFMTLTQAGAPQAASALASSGAGHQDLSSNKSGAASKTPDLRSISKADEAEHHLPVAALGREELKLDKRTREAEPETRPRPATTIIGTDPLD